MKTFRIGETLDIAWAIKTPDGNPYRLIGANVSLYVSAGPSTLYIPTFSCVDGVVRFTFEGVEQRRTGIHTLKLIENEDRNNQTIIEECFAFQLSDCSVKIDEGNSVEIDTVVNISQTIPEIQAGELERIANEQERIAAENERISAEKSRASAEALRSSSELERTEAETLRKTAEQSREAAEQSRTSAESERKANESGRVTAESARVTAESSRQVVELSRQYAESARAAAEQSRAQEFQTLKQDSQEATTAANQAADSAKEAAADALQTYLAIEIDETTGDILAVVGSEKTVFDSGEIDPETGDIILTINY